MNKVCELKLNEIDAVVGGVSLSATVQVAPKPTAATLAQPKATSVATAIDVSAPRFV